MFVATTDMTRLNRQIGGLREALIGSGQMGDAAVIIEDETRRFTKQVINLIPPPGLGQSAQQQGEMAVNRDLLKVFTPVNEDFLTHVGSEFGMNGIDTWFTHPGTGKHYELKWDRIDPTGSGMAGFHRANQNRRGRTRNRKRQVAGKWSAAYVIAFQEFNDYLKKIQSHVGWRKAAFGKFFKALGGRLPKWIDRHAGASASEMHNDLENRNNPSVTMIARAPGLLDDQRIVSDAVRIRAEAIRRRIKLILSGYAKDVKQGIIIARKEHRSYGEDL